MRTLIALLVYIVGLLGSVLILAGMATYFVVTVLDRRRRRVRIAIGVVCGYIGGALFIWSLVPRDWSLSLWTTVEAAANAETYGHPVEHYAEVLLMWMMFAGVVGSAIGAFVAAKVGTLTTRRRLART